jgi:hypothetical protein
MYGMLQSSRVRVCAFVKLTSLETCLIINWQ